MGHRLNPVGPGYLKLDGEYCAVLQGTNALVLVAYILFGAVTGYVFRDGNFLVASRRLKLFLR